MTPVIGSLCSGYGGLDMALSAATGGRVAWHVEYDKHPAAILAHRFPGIPNHHDVTSTDWSSVEPIDWLTAGYPCQPFSHAGKRKGTSDVRHVWPHVAGAIRVLRPRGVLLENVAGHLSLGFGQVLGDLAALGYDTRWLCLRAADAGAPHNRARVFILATDTASVGAADQPPRGDDLLPTLSALAGTGSGDRTRDHAQGDRLLGRRTEVVAATASAPEPENDGRQRSGRARDGWSGPADGSLTAADTDLRGCVVNEEQHGNAPQDPTDRHSRGGHADGHPGPGSDAADAASEGLEGRGAERGGQEPTQPPDSGSVQWGNYEPAIRRWERVTGRAAPRPTEPGRNGERLSARFVEWMMGLPEGHVTDVPGLPRNAQLKALGNGVVPQQAALAYALLATPDNAVSRVA